MRAVLQETQSSEHKVKIAGIMVSEQAEGGINNVGAVEYVHDISTRAQNGLFEVHNHARHRALRQQEQRAQQHGRVQQQLLA